MTEVIETVWITMPDGAKLAARLWLPDGARNTPVPCILEYIPYRRRDRTRMRDESMHPLFAEAGYASIRVDIRGYGDSDGVAEDEYSHQEIQDGHDIIAWIAAQAWCDGNVGMFGKSWGAYNAFQVAATRPPALKGIIPVMGTDDRWREDIHFYGGCLANDNFWWGSIMQLYNAMPPDPQIVGEDRWLEMWTERLEGAAFWPAMWLEHQTHDEMWRRGSVCEDYDAVDIPVYFFGGWADLFRDTPFRIAQHLKGPVKVMMGPWAHLYPHEGIPGPRVDFVGEAIRFWDHWLKGIDTGVMDDPPLRFFLQESIAPAGTQKQRTGRWVEEASWPSPNVEARALWLNTHMLDAAPEPGGDPLSICSPQTYGITGGDMCSFAIPGDMPVDGRGDAGGALVFRTEALAAPMDLLGQPHVSLKLSADRLQGFVAALLFDEGPDGSQTLLARGFCNLTHRNGDMAPEAIIPGEEMEVSVPLYGTGCRVAAGHRIALHIASAYWPVLWPAPEPVTLTVAPGTSVLHLPLRRAVDEPAPRDLPEPERQNRKRAVTRVREGSMERSLHTDLTTGDVTQRFFLDGGVFGPVGDMRLDDIGTVLSDISDRKYTIRADDPLSAKVTMEQTASFTRDDWQAKIQCYAEQTATKTEFHLTSRVVCWSGDEQVFERERRFRIPRDGM